MAAAARSRSHCHDFAAVGIASPPAELVDAELHGFVRMVPSVAVELIDERECRAPRNLDLRLLAAVLACDFLVHAAGHVDGNGRRESLPGLDRRAWRQLLLQLLRRALRTSVLTRLLGRIALHRLEADDDRDQPEDEPGIVPLHAAAPFTTPSFTAIRLATAAPEFNAPSI
jgi:hypothetical protein